MKRSCDGCTKCCEGWLTATIHGKKMSPGVPCHFVQLGKGCGIYKDRPADPCKGYECAWVKDDGTIFPEWLKPSLANVIIDGRKTRGGHPYWAVNEAGEPLRVGVLTWLIEYCSTHGVNLVWNLNGQPHYAGSPEFVAEMSQPHRH